MRLDFLERHTPGADSQTPVLVLIHGRGDSPENFIHLTQGLEAPRRELALRGLTEQPMGFGLGWEWFSSFIGDGDTPELRQEVLRAMDIIAGDLQALNATENQPNRRFVVSGFSQGGVLTFALALHHPELVSHALPIAGLLPPSCRPAELSVGADGPPITAFHGLADPLVCPTQAQELVRTLQELGHPAAFHGYAGVEHTVSSQMHLHYQSALNKALHTP